ncbi:MAG: LysR substrate-binding domain-containing protein [Hyphomicrobiales bacterium]|nr:LysR substrate-binding domain-containing protein [Hyphomicrobiales bacterium]
MPEHLRHLPPLSTLVAFETAFRLGSFTRAADELALSQASISRRVRELEDDLGVSLFERRRYDVTPTEEGEILGATVRVSLRELANTAERLRVRGDGTERLTIFSDMSLGNALVAPCVGEFQRLNPHLRLRVLSSYEPIESIREEFDIGLQYGSWAEDRFVVEPIANDVIFPVCSPDLLQDMPSPATPVDIAARPLLHLADVGRKWPDWRSFLAFFRLKEPKPIEGLAFNSYQICLDVAEQGEGIALGWGRSVMDRIVNGRLVRIPGLTMPLTDIVNIYKRKGSRPNPTAEKFVELLRSKITPVE